MLCVLDCIDGAYRWFDVGGWWVYTTRNNSQRWQDMLEVERNQGGFKLMQDMAQLKFERAREMERHIEVFDIQELQGGCVCVCRELETVCDFW